MSKKTTILAVLSTIALTAPATALTVPAAPDAINNHSVQMDSVDDQEPSLRLGVLGGEDFILNNLFMEAAAKRDANSSYKPGKSKIGVQDKNKNKTINNNKNKNKKGNDKKNNGGYSFLGSSLTA